MFKVKSDTERLILELLFINTIGLVASLSCDLWPNLLYAVGLASSSHVYNFGILQTAGVLFFGLGLYRANYYRKIYNLYI